MFRLQPTPLLRKVLGFWKLFITYRCQIIYKNMKFRHTTTILVRLWFLRSPVLAHHSPYGWLYDLQYFATYSPVILPWTHTNIEAMRVHHRFNIHHFRHLEEEHWRGRLKSETYATDRLLLLLPSAIQDTDVTGWWRQEASRVQSVRWFLGSFYTWPSHS